MALAIGDVVRVSAIIKDGRSQDVITTWDVHVAAVGSGGDDGFKTCAVEYVVALYGEVDDIICDDADATALSFYHRNGTKFLTPVAWTVPAFTNTNEELPDGDAALLVFRTAVRGVRGRKFIGPLQEGSNENGLLAAGTLTRLQAMGDEFIGGHTHANGWELEAAIWSQRDHVAYPPTECVVSTVWARQVRRRRSRGS